LRERFAQISSSEEKGQHGPRSLLHPRRDGQPRGEETG
jgi:hypothetical protein